MRVLVVSNGYPPRGKWGTEFYTRELVRGLAARGHEVQVLHPERSGTRPRYTLETVVEEGVQVHLLHNAGGRGKRFRESYQDAEVERVFRGLLERERFDVVHFTYLLWGLSVRMPLVAREAGVPSAVTLTDYGLLCHRGQMYDWRLARCHGPHPPEVCARCVREPSPYDGRPVAVAAKRAVARLAAAAGGAGLVVVPPDVARREDVVRESLAAVGRLIAPTAVIEDAFAGWGIPRERFVRLVYSFDETPLVAARRPPEGERIRFGFLGQFTPHKGLGTLLRAVAIMERRLPESVEPWDLRLYGGPAGGRHRQYAERLFAEHRGPRVLVQPAFEPEEAGGVLSRLSAVVIPSEWDENAPLVALQARAAGIPVVGSDVPGIREVVEHGRHGLLVPPGDPAALADALREILLSRWTRTAAPGLPVSLDDHLARIEAVHRELAANACRESHSQLTDPHGANP